MMKKAQKAVNWLRGLEKGLGEAARIPGVSKRAKEAAETIEELMTRFRRENKEEKMIKSRRDRMAESENIETAEKIMMSVSCGESRLKCIVCSEGEPKSDLFTDSVPDERIKQVFEECEAAPRYRFLFLTKNPARFGRINGWNHQYNNKYAKDNMWFGVNVTRQCELNRIRDLPYGNAHTVLSLEPMLERIDLDRYLPTADTRWRCSYCGHYADTYANHCYSCGRKGGYSGSFREQPVNWIILGAESGNRKGKATPRREWIDSIVKICDERNIPVFMKENLHDLMGDDFRQEFPWKEIDDDQ